METNYFLELQKVKCEVEKKNWLNYISWSDGWAELKKVYPDAIYRKVKNGETYLFRSWTWWSVECEVTVWGITHCADLAITDFRNQEIKYEAIKSTDIQNTLQRAFAKAIAMHWIWLYVYRGEDFPEDEKDTENHSPETKTKTYEYLHRLISATMCSDKRKRTTRCTVMSNRRLLGKILQFSLSVGISIPAGQTRTHHSLRCNVQPTGAR